MRLVSADYRRVGDKPNRVAGESEALNQRIANLSASESA